MNFDVFDFGHIKLLFEKLTLIEFDLYRHVFINILQDCWLCFCESGYM